MNRWGHLRGVFFTLAAALSSFGCSLVIDTDSLTAGKDGLECTEAQKICPVDDQSRDVYECVAVDTPEHGCSAESCSPCALPGAVARCDSRGTCAIAVCSDRNENCDGDDANGCEIDTAQDLDNCGACGRRCERDNAVMACIKGVCEAVVCVAPFDDCDGNPANGCETNLNDSAAHCGACTTPCSGTCVAGECNL